jgi:hypothetical protein
MVVTYYYDHRPMKKIIYRLKNRVQDFKINFKTKFNAYKEKPKSKRKSFLIGFTTAVSIFGLTLFGPVLSAVAKEIPKGNPKPTDVVPAPVAPPSQQIVNTSLSGLAASVCSLAITSGSFAVGVACGFVVVIGILHIQGK